MFRAGAGLVLIGLTVGSQAQIDAAPPITLPLSPPIGQSFIVDHRDQRRLPGGGQAVFRQQHQLRFSEAAGDTILSYQALSVSCEGPAAICAAFASSLGNQPGPAYQFRLDSGGALSLVSAAGEPLSASTSAATLINQRERAAPGAALGADLRLLLRFANMALPAPSRSAMIEEGRLSLTELTPHRLSVQVDRATSAAATGSALNGRVTCQINRATGLVEQCRMLDWLDSAADEPLRLREIEVRPAMGPVS
jgi:hypothetical protein